MGKKTLIIIAVILVAVMGGIAYLIGSGGETARNGMQESFTLNTSSDGSSTVAPSDSSTRKGQYVDYREGIVAETQGTKLLFFHAPWCPQCRDLEDDIEAKGVPDGMTIIKVDYDSNQALRKKYGVTIQTTIVHVNDEGEEVSKHVAYNDPTLKAVEAGIFSR
ncbi:thioredoxin family protein [Candidatus Saccharibacteria bacterium]|nr:thioredoxin family protein [Candidatus Saccharibacteria bacterium]